MGVHVEVQEERVRLRSRFVRAVGEVEAAQPEPASPSQLSRVAAGLLGAAGAGLVMSHRLVRLPVGASDEHARVAEEVQAGLGAGPCLTAEATRSVLAADRAELGERWPLYYEQLTRRTPFRATVSFPLFWARVGFGALNLYYSDSTAALDEELDIVQDEVADEVGIRLLLHQLAHHARVEGDGGTDETGPGDRGGSGSSAPGGERRQRVFVAVGMLQEAGALSDVDALAILRGFAFRTDRLLGDVADDLVGRRLRTGDVLDIGT